MIYDDIGRHLDAARTFDRAAVPLGMYLAWCANLQLLSREFADTHAALVMRVRFREITGAELLVAGAAGRLDAAHLNEEGQRFTAAYLPQYLDDFRATFGVEPYDVKDDWDHYDRIAKLLTRKLMTTRQADAGQSSRILGTTDQRWWRRKR
jgi:hypothetical protein